MSHSTDDHRILGEIERGLTRDDPALASLIESLNAQLPRAAKSPGHASAPRPSRRTVAVAVLAVIALLALILTVMLSGRSTPPEGTDGGPAALSAHSAPVGHGPP
ncbi:DUF3040 domain-containing protein [Streptomyces sp. NPDC006553]|uniref:DUF3040 domain-containing protein n=1 Tax=unclassified Streptomyces TaxID=2593676 RepID=UPI002251B9FA|nr:DUF3040 domain-containing protein [Streptomyces sp. NBC_00233]MCX5232433.1 DUF3040 domain-containing protein [Streptomyces sp. NBC_00233]